jgi:uncharacterized protein (TIGR03663 family)
MQRAALLIFCWICLIAAGAWLRFEDLGKRPFHADEATGARITAKRLESGGVGFDPKHYHGPLLSGSAMPLCRWNEQTRWQDLRKSTLRTIPAAAGTLLLLLPLLGRRRFGDPAMLFAAACLATSPLLVYYSRMFIHESLLVLLGMAVPWFLPDRRRWWLAGVLTGLMFATKETFAISVLAWTGAALLLAWEKRGLIDRAALLRAWRECRLPAAVAVTAAALASMFFYTGGFRNPQGAVDAIRTFFVYETVGGHDKPFFYYFQLLALPEKAGGRWWFETPLLVAALVAYAGTFRSGWFPPQSRDAVRFLSYSAAGHFLIYSLIGYKTPWLACLPWAHVAVVAGFAVAPLAGRGLAGSLAALLFAAACLVPQVKVSRNAVGCLASDVRNPYAYVPTRMDVERLEDWLVRLREVVGGPALEPVAVAGADYWPLPWYLRSFGRIGYWPEPVPAMREMPLVLAMPETADAMAELLGDTHAALPRGLRPDVPVMLFVRNDLWKKWMENDSR